MVPGPSARAVTLRACGPGKESGGNGEDNVLCKKLKLFVELPCQSG
jgi:hypothetical protein